LVVAMIAGSALAGAKEAQRSTDSLQATAGEVQAAYNQITATIGSLGTLMSAQVGDLRPMLKDFSAQVKQLQADAESAKSRAIKMQDMNKAYFATWAQEIASISDPAIKAQSQARLQESFASYQKVEQGLVQTRDAYVPLMSSLTDLETALNLDLSPAGKAALQPSFAKVREQAVPAQAAIQATKAAIQAALGGLTPRASGIVM
jgi:hypothetical protein